MSDIPSFLNTGLKKGFTGETEFLTLERAGFPLHGSHFIDGDAIYHDEWAVNRVGGGQELVKVGGQMYTRVYAGGTIATGEMEKLGITKKDVMGYLFACIKEFGEQIRLHEDVGPRSQDEWTYEYKVIEKNNEVPMTTGKEMISYKGKVVFIHVFVMCPVE